MSARALAPNSAVNTQNAAATTPAAVRATSNAVKTTALVARLLRRSVLAILPARDAGPFGSSQSLNGFLLLPSGYILDAMPEMRGTKKQQLAQKPGTKSPGDEIA